MNNSNPFQEGIVAFMKFASFQIVLALLVSVFSFASDIHGQELLERRVSLQVENENLKSVLRRIENQIHIKFTYNAELIANRKKISISMDSVQLREVLDRIFDENIGFEVVDDQVVLRPLKRLTGVAPLAGSVVADMQINGTVTDEKSEALPGVNVLEKGTTNGTTTDVEGRFSLNVKDESAVLVFSFIGYTSQEVAVGSKTNFSVALQPDVTSLQEVVVIGYGERDKKDLTGAVAQINSEEITKSISLTPEFAMQGRMPGVFISNPGSNPNARPQIRIRGVSTLGFNDPLYVIDGIPLTEGGASDPNARSQDQRGPINIFNMINPNDIESISVLKDASATAIYGVRASNGVILITTKRGKAGAMKVDVAARYGIQNINKEWDVMDTQQYVDAHLEAWANNTAATPNQTFYRYYDPTNPEYLGNNGNFTEDWVRKSRVRNAALADYNVTLSGGNEKSNYSVGAGYADQRNALYQSRFQRYSTYVNSDHKFAKIFRAGQSIRLVYSETSEDSGLGMDASFIPPWQPLYDPNGRDGYALPGRTVAGTFQSRGYGNSTRDNFAGIGDLNYNERNMLRTLGTMYAEVTPFEGFRVKGTISVDYYTNERDQYLDVNRGFFEATRGTSYGSAGNTYNHRINENINLVKEFLVGYTRSFGEHNIDVIFNAMDQKVNWNNYQLSVNNLSPITSYDQRRIEEGWDPLTKGSFYERSRSGLQGYMGRVSYNFNSKYYLDVTVRRDGTSKFGPGHKWGTFPSVGAAWRISQEKFMSGISFLTDLKLRGSWGKTGNQETRDFAYLSLVNTNPKYSTGTSPVLGNGAVNAAAVLGDFPIVDMSWETVTSSGAGFDAAFMDGKLSLTAEYYNRKTEGILQAIDIPWVVGAITSPVVNLATVTNQGIEVETGYRDNIGEFGYNVSVNFTSVRNRVGSLYRNRATGGNSNRIETGSPINFIWGYRTDGIFQSQQEVDDWLAANGDAGFTSQKSPGDIRYLDVAGAPAQGSTDVRTLGADGKIDQFDQVYLGKTIAGYYYGINLGADYKNFDLTVSLRGVGDVQRIRTDGKKSIGAGGANFLTDYLGRWTPENPSNTIPRAIEGDPSGNNRIASRHVEDAGFFRLQTVQLGYSFRQPFINTIGLTNLRCYVAGSNLFVVSPYTGLDPEDDSTPTAYSVGVNLTF